MSKQACTDANDSDLSSVASDCSTSVDVDQLILLSVLASLRQSADIAATAERIGEKLIHLSIAMKQLEAGRQLLVFDESVKLFRQGWPKPKT